MSRADFQLIDAIRSGCLADFNAAVNAGAYHSACDWTGTPALVVAYKTQRPGYARRLIALGADPHNIRDRRRNTLLIRSARTGDIGLLTVLLNEDIDPSVAGQRDRTALRHAAKHRFDFVARSLIDHGANLDARDNHRHAPLYLAAMHGRTGVVRELLRAGTTTNAQNHTNYTPDRNEEATGFASRGPSWKSFSTGGIRSFWYADPVRDERTSLCIGEAVISVLSYAALHYDAA